MSATYSHVVFDLDGTLLNTIEDLANAGNHVCWLHGWPTFTIDAYRYKVGNGIFKLIERIVPAAGNFPSFAYTISPVLYFFILCAPYYMILSCFSSSI